MYIYEHMFSDNDMIIPIHAVDLNYHAHFHKSFEMVFCAAGTLSVTISGIHHILTAGQAVLIPPNTVHSFESTHSSELYALLFGQRVIPEFSALLLGKLPKKYTFPVDDVLCTLMPGCFKDNHSSYAAKAMLYHACELFINGNDFMDGAPLETDAAFKILTYIQDHFREELTLQAVADQNGYSYSYVSRLVQQHFGMPFSRLIAHYRVDYAKSLLRARKYSIADVAMYSGFGSIRNFNRVFHKITGFTPSAFIKA